MADADLELLARYRRDPSEDAFEEIVRRYLDFVHSTAMRQVRCPQLAKDVTQSTFIKLAREAHRLTPDTILSAWLYQVTRRAAIDVVRCEARRKSREQIAVCVNEMNANTEEWTRIEPILDDAMHSLDDADRTALLLRFFEKKSLREVGQTLGTTADTARKRVTRAVERLREYFQNRGVNVRTGGLAAIISANSVQAAPIGLATTISTAAFLSGAATFSTASATSNAILMTITKKLFAAVIFTAAVGTAIFQSRHAAMLRAEVLTLQQSQGMLAEQLDQMSRDREAAANRLALVASEMERASGNPSELLKLRGEVARLRRDSQEVSGGRNSFAEATLRQWAGRVRKLRQFSDENPSLQIPEFKLLTEEDWLDEAREKTRPNMKKTQLDTEKDLKRAMANLRMKGKSNFATVAGTALKEYLAQNSVFPTELSQLKPYLKTELDEEILHRYSIEHSGTLGRRGWERVITDKPLANEEHQEHIIIGPTGWEWGPRQGRSTADQELAAIISDLEPLKKEYEAANNGREATDPLQLQPFIKTPKQQSAFQKLVEKRNASQKTL